MDGCTGERPSISSADRVLTSLSNADASTTELLGADVFADGHCAEAAIVAEAITNATKKELNLGFIKTLSEVQYRPILLQCRLFQPEIRVHRNRMPHDREHRQVRDRIGISI